MSRLPAGPAAASSSMAATVEEVAAGELGARTVYGGRCAGRMWATAPTYSAQVTGAPIFDASRSFDPGTSVTSVGGFSLKFNAAPLTSPTCSTALALATCHGWQQFIYSSTNNVVFMQY
jgi:hypothetical protein